MRNFLFFICCLTSLIIVAQNNAKIVSGTIYLDSLALEDVHIINPKLDIGSVSDKKGRFEILAAKGDVLIISHVNFEYKEHVITEGDLRSKQINIHLDSKTYMLHEIVLKKKRGIFEVDKDILIYKGPIVNAQTLKLPYAKNQQSKDEKTVALNSGVSISLGGLANALNGNTKQEIVFKKQKIEDKNILKIRKHFTDSFFIYQLKITKENINPFLELCISKGIINLYRKNKFLELTTILLDNSKNSPYLLHEENTRITQK